MLLAQTGTSRLASSAGGGQASALLRPSVFMSSQPAPAISHPMAVGALDRPLAWRAGQSVNL
ncbi:AMP-ligase, partial [Xanthomonas vasicola]